MCSTQREQKNAVKLNILYARATQPNVHLFGLQNWISEMPADLLPKQIKRAFIR